jgi:hypothetical protein
MHVEKFKDDFPLAAAELGRNLYVDDLLSGTDTVEEALALQRDAVQLMAKAGLPIRKWCSSDAEVMKGIPETERGALGRHLLTSQLQDEQDCEVETRPSSSALGVEWFIEGDTLRYTGFSKMNLPEGQCTKREVVAAVASFFDPLGLIAPFICMDLLPVAAFLMKNFPLFTFPLLSLFPPFTKSASLPFIASLFSSLRASLLTVVLYLLLPFLYHYVLYVYMCVCLLGFVCVTNINSLIPISVIYGCPFLLLSSSSDRFLCYSILKD